MVSMKSIEEQMKRIKFATNGWGKSEVKELPNILMSDEEIYECVNGTYEGGFALLVATDARLLLVDKKPLNHLTVEDLRFDMINELDYNHRMIGAYISISAGSKNLKFRSYNQPRLRKLIGHVQHCMAESKKQMSNGQRDQRQHLEQINQQLQAYLIAQYQQQQALTEQLRKVMPQAADNGADMPQTPKPSPELSDFLFAQSLLKQYREEAQAEVAPTSQSSTDEDSMVKAAEQEVFGKSADPQPAPVQHFSMAINPLRVAYSRLPTALRQRRAFNATQAFPRPLLQTPSVQDISSAT